MSTYICSFTSGLDDMPRKDQGDVVKVLRVLEAAGRFSVYEASANDTIARMMSRLCHKGCTIMDSHGNRREYGRLIETDKSCGYPWTKVTLTEAGKRLLADHAATASGEKPKPSL